MGRAMQMVFCVVVFAVLLAACHLWLSRFRYGPMEWVWRAITYWRAPSMRWNAWPPPDRTSKTKRPARAVPLRFREAISSPTPRSTHARPRRIPPNRCRRGPPPPTASRARLRVGRARGEVHIERAIPDALRLSRPMPVTPVSPLHTSCRP
jgi:hypothetical protein